jgi:hypothetical protein
MVVQERPGRTPDLLFIMQQAVAVVHIMAVVLPLVDLAEQVEVVLLRLALMV